MNDTGGRRLWIGNLDERITEFTLLKLLQKYGKIEQFDFLFHKSGPNQGKPRGYCFASFENRTDAVHAVHALDGKLALGKKLAVKWAHSHIKAPNDPVPLEQVINLHPDKIPSSFGGQSTKVPEEPTPKRKPVISSVDSQIRAIEGKLREMERSTAKSTFKPVPVYGDKKKPLAPTEITEKCLPSLLSLPVEPPSSRSTNSSAVTSSTPTPSDESSSALQADSTTSSIANEEETFPPVSTSAASSSAAEVASSAAAEVAAAATEVPKSPTVSKTNKTKSHVIPTGKHKTANRPKPYDKR